MLDQVVGPAQFGITVRFLAATAIAGVGVGLAARTGKVFWPAVLAGGGIGALWPKGAAA